MAAFLPGNARELVPRRAIFSNGRSFYSILWCLMATVAAGWCRAFRAGQVPVMAAGKRRLVTGIIHGEIASIVVIVLCAAIMARSGWV